MSQTNQTGEWLIGGSEMGALIRAKNWSKTSLGPIESWPHSLRTTVSICLASDLPICIIWGPDLVQIYNDGYRVICGGKHPRSMGQNFAECWREAWPVIGGAHDSALAGDTAFLENQHIFLERHGYVEECFFTFSFSPIRDESGRVVGLFHPIIEMTAKMLGERRTRALRDVAARTANAKTVQEACALVGQSLADQELDVPFALMYVFVGVGTSARLVASTGIPDSAEGNAMSSVMPQLWALAEVPAERHGEVVEKFGARFGDLRCGPYPESPREAVALPLVLPGAERPVGVLIAGVSGRLKLNQAYRDFYELLGAAVTTAVANGRAFEEERKRAEALAELDRVKTAFFFNVSHEFRTPLTLMLGPLEDALANAHGHLPPGASTDLEISHRNALRLLKLANTMLDFSRIEAGRILVSYHPTDLPVFTAELASNFRSACDKAGLRLIVDCQPFNGGERVFVDRDMWEKIVLNLMSNAFKFTLKGEIEVSVREVGLSGPSRLSTDQTNQIGQIDQTDARHVILTVRDTGVGIPTDELPRMFERFHRVERSRGRTHEGTGIGLALVQELVKLHGGTVHVESVFNEGSTFTVTIPFGTAHLDPRRIGTASELTSTSIGSSPFVEEALRWLPTAIG
ncbi:MAG: sensory box protein [Thermomicrobiales bacterium]|nr:sensory box protein [Thermomicrobiales bacterium]